MDAAESRWETHAETVLREAREELPGAPEWFFEHLADTVHDRPLGDSSVAFPERSEPEHVVFWASMSLLAPTQLKFSNGSRMARNTEGRYAMSGRRVQRA